MILALLIWLLVLGVVLYVVRQVPMEEWVRNVINAVIALVVIVYVIRLLLTAYPFPRM
jgi:arginine exporter protein ArgO